MADEEEVLRKAKELSWPERLGHANWRVRSDAFSDVLRAAEHATAITDNEPLVEFGARVTAPRGRPRETVGPSPARGVTTDGGTGRGEARLPGH